MRGCLRVSFDCGICLVREAGHRALLEKSDTEPTFQLLLVDPDCYHHLGGYMDGNYIFDTCLHPGLFHSMPLF